MHHLHNIKISCNKSLACAPIVIISKLMKNDECINIEWGQATALEIIPKQGQAINFTSVFSICRFLARTTSEALYGTTILQKTEVDHWLEFCSRKYTVPQFKDCIQKLDKTLLMVTYLVGDAITLADICVWTMLYGNKQFQGMLQENVVPQNLIRWYTYLSNQEPFTAVMEMFPLETNAVKSGKSDSMKVKVEDRGKFIDLPGAEMGKVVTRFPPEASGYLHIGHAKAALLNAYYQESFQGKLIMRFDDTNPEKEKEDFEKVILEDVSMLQIKPDIYTYTSDHFEVLLEKCEALLKLGAAYVDDTDPEIMKSERELRQESKNRNNDISKNWSMWEEMKKGTDYGKNCCVRAKIDMTSDNGCLRDPTLYRCKSMSHPRTGTKYQVYPTYDFACPIVDSLEGVTHALRTTEYHDRDDQYFWILDKLQLRKPYIYEYSRLNMTHTVLSKRKLTWFVEQGIVDGWDDPRMPTVRGVLRRGMTVEGLRQFIVAQGSSRSVVVMEWDKIWAFNKKVIDPVSPRYNAVEKNNCVPVFVEGAERRMLQVDKHPKNPELGKKDIYVGPKLLIDSIDAELMKVGENVTFINWGNLIISNIKRKCNGEIESVSAKLNLDNKDYKKTLKITWVIDLEDMPLVPCICVYYDHLISKPVLNKDEDFKDFLNDNTKITVHMLGDQQLSSLKKGDIIQIQRKGFFICDEPYDSSTLRYTSCEAPVVLFYIPDGTKDTSALPNIVKSIQEKKESVKEKCSSMRGKSAEKSPQEEQLTLTSTLDISNSIALDSGYQSVLDSSIDLDSQIKTQGDIVRKLKAEKADKSVIDENVQLLLKLKTEFKSCTGKEWKPNVQAKGDTAKNPKKLSTPKQSCPQSNKEEASIAKSDVCTELDGKIRVQGDYIRKLKAEKAEKSQIDANVQQLLKLKSEFKACSGLDWKPDLKVKELLQQPKESGDGKASKTPTKNKEDIKSGLFIKEEINQEELSGAALELDQQIKDQGDVVRKLKAEKADKSTIDNNVKKLLMLKENYKNYTGKDWKPDVKAKESASNQVLPNKGAKLGSEKTKNATKNNTNEKCNPKDVCDSSESALKKITRLGLESKKEENLAEWYSQVLTKAEMIEYYDVSGCYILRPWAYSIWEAIQKFFDTAIKSLGVTNCYFPMFVSLSALEKEKTHIEDFAPEVAWVTKSGSSDLEKPIAIRPTSETVMYPSFAKWIRSHRDLPLRLNQWCSVVRWEFRNPQPFIRTREFLWQEGHTAFANKEEAENEVYTILDLYGQVYEYLLAIPVIRGKKTEKEKFAGADFTTTTEAYVSANGRGIQGATSHHLGQNFSKMFEIIYDDPDTNEKQFVYQNSWGLSTRTIGAMVLIHGDNTGLVLPPRVAAHQVVIVPCGITASLKESERDSLLVKCSEFESILRNAGISVKGDYRDNYSPGWKFNYWELKGVPVRVELGPKDLKKNQFVAVRRDTGEKVTMGMDTAPNSVLELLDNIHNSMYDKAKKSMEEHLCVSYNWAEFCHKLDKKFIIMAPFCGEISCEDKIKKDSTKSVDEMLDPGAPSMGAKSLCIPFQQPAELVPDTKCIHPDCSKNPKFFTLFGRSY